MQTTDLPRTPLKALIRYAGRRPWTHAGVLISVILASLAGVAVQYGMKLLVDAMNAGHAAPVAVWRAFAVFVGGVAIETALWRLSGWSGCRAFVKAGVDFRLDLFQHVAKHGARYFADRLSGALGNRISACAGALQAIETTLAWNVIPPVTGFAGAILVLAGVHWPIAVALAVGVAALAVMLVRIGMRGRPLHRESAQASAEVSGEIVDVMSNIDLVRLFSGAAASSELFLRMSDAVAPAHEDGVEDVPYEA